MLQSVIGGRYGRAFSYVLFYVRAKSAASCAARQKTVRIAADRAMRRHFPRFATLKKSTQFASLDLKGIVLLNRGVQILRVLQQQILP
jgi:hypothetical protein